MTSESLSDSVLHLSARDVPVPTSLSPQAQAILAMATIVRTAVSSPSTMSKVGERWQPNVMRR